MSIVVVQLLIFVLYFYFTSERACKYTSFSWEKETKSLFFDGFGLKKIEKWLIFKSLDIDMPLSYRLTAIADLSSCSLFLLLASVHPNCGKHKKRAQAFLLDSSLATSLVY
jgi:hypothetical protein